MYLHDDAAEALAAGSDVEKNLRVSHCVEVEERKKKAEMSKRNPKFRISK